MAARRGVKLALDTSGPALKASLGHGIDLLNSSLSEFETIVGRESSEPSTRAMQTVDLVRSGIARMMALTLGSEGALRASKRP